jgi:recombination protein RecA
MQPSTAREAPLSTLMLASRMGLPQQRPQPDERWSLDALAGRFVELSTAEATPVLTISMGLVLQAQERSEPAIWIAAGSSTFYPPDAADSGVDLEALPVVRVPGVLAGVRAADILLRSGGATLVVLDLIGAADPVPGAADRARSRPVPAFSPRAKYAQMRWSRRVETPSGQDRAFPDRSFGPGLQTRLAALAQKHRATLLCLTRKGRTASSLGSLVSLRAVGDVRKTAFDRFLWELMVLRDKHQAPGWNHSEACRGPAGLY